MATKLIPWDTVLPLLQSIAASLEEFRHLLIEEEQAVKTLNREKIMDLVERKERILGTVHGCEQQVISTLSPWVPSETFQACRDLLRNAETSQGIRASALLEEIGGMLPPIRDQGRKNAGLIRRGQYVVLEAFNIIAAGLGNSPVYQETGTLRVHHFPGSVSLQG